MIAEGWSNQAVGATVRELLSGWFALPTEVAAEAEARYGSLGPFTAEEIGTLIGNCFIGAEALILLGFERNDLPVRAALRRIGVLIRDLETRRPALIVRRETDEHVCGYASFAQTYPTVADFIEAQYQCETRIGRYSLWMAK